MARETTFGGPKTFGEKETTFGRHKQTTFSEPDPNQPNGLGLPIIDKLYDQLQPILAYYKGEGINVTDIVVSNDMWIRMSNEYQTLGFRGVPETFCDYPIYHSSDLEGPMFLVNTEMET